MITKALLSVAACVMTFSAFSGTILILQGGTSYGSEAQIV